MLKHFKQLPSHLHGLDATNPSVQVFHFRKWAKWAFSQRGDGKLGLQARFARIALGPKRDRNCRITVNYGVNSMIFGRAT